MTFADSLRGWLNQSRPLHAQPAEPAELPPDQGCAGCAGSACLGEDRISVVATLLPEEAAGWGSDAIDHYLDRLGRADELGMDTSPGSVAEQVARRETRRVAAMLPQAWTGTRGRGVLDAVIDAFPGARLVGYIDPSEVAPVWPPRPESPST